MACLATPPYADRPWSSSPSSDEVTPDVVSAFVRLIPQLSTSAPPVTADDLAEMVASDATHVLIATGDDGAGSSAR